MWSPWEGLAGTDLLGQKILCSPALTGEWGEELDNGWLSAEGVIPTGLTAIIILVTVHRGHLVRSADGQARRWLAWAWGHCFISLDPLLQARGLV